MPESADKMPPRSHELGEESDVIELTDEVRPSAPIDDVDILGFEMPEFKVPERSAFAAGQVPLEDDDEQAAEEPNLPALSLEDGAETEPAIPVSLFESLQEQEPEYDRQAMVKTIQMDAIDRATLESLTVTSAGEDTALLDDARYSPAIVAHPPALLIRKWQEGLPATALAVVGGGAPPPRSAPATIPEIPTARMAIPEPESPRAPDGEPPKRPRPGEAPPAAAAVPPPAAASPPVAAAAAPPVASPPAKEEEPPVTPTPAPDDEMGSLVKELLEEKKKNEAPQQRVRPRDIWFQEVFSEEYLRTIPPNIAQLTRREVDFIEGSLRLKKQSRILDLACGFGRHSIELAERGYEMAGVDLSLPLLERAAKAAEERNLDVKFIHGDMRELNFAGIFDGCFIWDTSLGFFDDRTNLRVLQGVHRALKPGGRILVDVINRDYVIRQTPTRLWWEGHGCIFLEESEFDYPTSTLQAKRSFIYEDGTPPLEQNSYVRLYSAHELRQMLHVAGFKVLEVSGERHHKGYFLGASSTRIIVLAEKRAKKRPAN